MSAGVRANFLLRVIVHPQLQEVQEVVEIDFPVRLGVRGERQILPRLLARDARGEPRFVRVPRQFLQCPFRSRQRLALPGVQEARAALAVVGGLPAPLPGGVCCAASMATE